MLFHACMAMLAGMLGAVSGARALELYRADAPESVPARRVAASVGTTAERSAHPDSFKDCVECPDMVTIPAGRFAMGAAPGEEVAEQLGEEFRYRSEPRREVNVGAFVLGRYEVTRGQFQAFARATGHRGPGCFVWADEDFRLVAENDWRAPGYDQTDDHPVTCVSWEDAVAYSRWLSRISGKAYRLPSESEWEYAARAHTVTGRYWGDDPAVACEFGNGNDLAAAKQRPDARRWSVIECNDRYAYTAPVGSYRPNAFGLFDMLGNAGEWTQDCWTDSYVGAPSDARARTNGNCAMRAVRGGAWDDAFVGLRASYRVGSPVTIRLYSRGFRVARDL